MHDVGRIAFRVEIELAVAERPPMSLAPLSEARQHADAGDPGLSRHRCPAGSPLPYPPPLPGESREGGGKSIAAATCSMPARNFGSGNIASRNVSSLPATVLPAVSTVALVIVNPEPSWTMLAVTVKACPGDTKVRNFASLTDARNGIRSNLVRPMSSQPDACAIVSISSTPGING